MVTYVDVKQYRLQPAQQLQLRLRFLVCYICYIHSIHLLSMHASQNSLHGMRNSKGDHHSSGQQLANASAEIRPDHTPKHAKIACATHPIDALKVAKPAIVLDDRPQ